MDSPDTLNSLLSKFNKVVKDKSQTPSLNIPRVIKDGYEPIKLEGNKVFSPKISNKDNSDTKKTQQKNNINSDSFIEHELPSKELILEDLSQQSSSQPPSLFPTHTAGRKLSTIAEKTNIFTTIQHSELDSQILRPVTALSGSSSSDGSVSLKELEVSDLSVSLEEKFDNNCVTLKNRRVYNNNRDTLPKIFKDQDISAEQAETSFIAEEDEQILSDNSTITSNNLIPITSEYPTSSILNSSSSSLFSDSIHSDKSILGDIYNSIPSSPPPSTISNISSTPLKNTKSGLRREDKYPSPRTYFSRKSGPMGDLTGGLPSNGRVNFIYLFIYLFFFFFLI
jgi:hypothetical protein